MGTRTDVVDSCLYIEPKDIEKFKSWLVANKIIEDKLTKLYFDSISIEEPITNNDGSYTYPIILDLDDFKIIGYWYPEFKTFIQELYDNGLNGHIELTCEGTDAIIRFDTDVLIVSIRHPGEYEDFKLNEI